MTGIRPGVVKAFVKAQPGNPTGDARAKPHPKLERGSINGLYERGSNRITPQTDGLLMGFDRHSDAGVAGLEVGAVVNRAAHNRERAGSVRLPRVGPGFSARCRMPLQPSIH